MWRGALQLNYSDKMKHALSSSRNLIFVYLGVKYSKLASHLHHPFMSSLSFSCLSRTNLAPIISPIILEFSANFGDSYANWMRNLRLEYPSFCNAQLCNAHCGDSIILADVRDFVLLILILLSYYRQIILHSSCNQKRIPRG